MDYIGPFTFAFLRSVIAVIVLVPMSILSKEKSQDIKTTVKGGIICGLALGIANCFQQYGILYTTSGKAGFITALYIIMIPIAYMIFYRRKATPLVWISILLSTVGIYLLCVNENFSINRGDIFVFFCAVSYTAQIMAVSKYSPEINAYLLCAMQFAVAGIIALPLMLFLESPTIGGVCKSWLPLLYTGVLSSGVAYTLQIIGERELNPTVAAIIMSLESCISVIAGWLILGQSLTLKEISGCIIMFIAIILAQLPAKNQ